MFPPELIWLLTSQLSLAFIVNVDILLIYVNVYHLSFLIQFQTEGNFQNYLTCICFKEDTESQNQNLPLIFLIKQSLWQPLHVAFVPDFFILNNQSFCEAITSGWPLAIPLGNVFRFQMIDCAQKIYSACLCPSLVKRKG